MPERGEVLASGTLGDLLSIIEAIEAPQTDDGEYELYTTKGVTSLALETPCAVIFTPDFEELDWLPDYAKEHGLEPVYEVILMQDVMRNARHQTPNPTLPELIAALNYYQEMDAFLDLGFYRSWKKYGRLE